MPKQLYVIIAKGPKLNTVFELWYHQCWEQRHGHFPNPAGHTMSDSGQDAICFLGHLDTLLAHAKPAVSQHSWALFAAQAPFYAFLTLSGLPVIWNSCQCSFLIVFYQIAKYIPLFWWRELKLVEMLGVVQTEAFSPDSCSESQVVCAEGTELMK